MIKHKGGIIILMTLVCAVGVVVGVKYFKFAKEDPAYCAMCHRTKEGYTSHQKSPHYTLTCQTCHSMTSLEGNKMLLGYYVKGDKGTKQAHGRVRPWENCIACHDSDASQGSVTFKNSYGHARHVFMHDINCGSCHQGDMHVMEVDSAKCRKCHEDKLVHGMGTAGLKCLNCHSFADSSEKMQPSRQCSECHPDLRTGRVMSGLQCHDCHRPHNKLKLQNQDCLGNCHSSETRVGQHALHLKDDKLGCMDCHRPHAWEVTNKNAPGLCDRCHKIKDPKTFIY